MKLRNFKYTAINKEGKPVKGKIEAINRQICLKYLSSKNYNDIKIKEYSNLYTTLNNITIGKLLKTKDLIFFLKQLGSLLNSGINILTALELLALQKEKRNLRVVYFQLYYDVYNGFSFSQALAKRPKDFPKLLVQMIEIGEMSGDLPKMVLDIADYYDRQTKITAGIKSAIRMPIIYMAVTLMVAVGMIIFVFPNFTNLYESFDNAELPGITQFFLDVSDFVMNNGLYILLGLLSIASIVVLLNRLSPKIHHGLVIILLNLPVVGKLIQMHNQIMIANGLSQMLSNGVNPLNALKTIYSLLNNTVYKEIIKKNIDYIEDGLPFAKAFEESQYIDSVMSKMIATGEQTSDIPNLMVNLSKYYGDISDIRIEKLKNTLQPVLLLFVYGILGIMILAIMLPMIALGGQI
jgi:type II secretory pathway component PulF